MRWLPGTRALPCVGAAADGARWNTVASAPTRWGVAVSAVCGVSSGVQVLIGLSADRKRRARPAEPLVVEARRPRCRGPVPRAWTSWAVGPSGTAGRGQRGRAYFRYADRDGIRHANARWSGLRTIVVMTTRHRTLGDTVALDGLDLRARLRPADSAHVAVLAEVLDDTPPVLVLVDGDGLRLLDGFMRVDAARRLGRSTLRVEWVRGDEATAIERAVRANASHGLPLSRSQRREAGLRLLALAPGWSDRRIASACGMDPKSVGRWRRDAAARSGGELPHPSTEERVGRDGRRYLVGEELEARRETARQLLRDDASLSDREVGRRSGLSAGAVGRVRVDLAPPAVGGSADGHRRSPMVRRLLRSLRLVVGRVALVFGRVLRRR